MSRPPNTPFFSVSATSAASAFVATCGGEGSRLAGFCGFCAPRVAEGTVADAAWRRGCSRARGGRPAALRAAAEPLSHDPRGQPAGARSARQKPSRWRRGLGRASSFKLVWLAASRLEAPRRAGRRGLLAETH